ncbi:hypothetical protein ACFL2O_05160 [Thermodesulfobacteriota bacterium]
MSSVDMKKDMDQYAYGMANYNNAERMEDKIKRLEHELAKVLGYHDEETLLLARTALNSSKDLSRQYKAFHPPLFHNALINIGIKKRGLCCHWTQDLLELLNGLGLKKFSLIWGVSKYGSVLEHSSVVAVRKGEAFDSGIVLDPWRYAGDLYWSKVKDDKYEWKRHPDDDGTVIIGCNGVRKKKKYRKTKDENIF